MRDKLSYKQQTPIDFKNLSGLIICLLRSKSCIFVGAFFERPRANTVRPYRGLDDFPDKNTTLLRDNFFVFYKYSATTAIYP